MTDEKTRIREILTAEHAELLPALARHLAFACDYDVDVCVGILAAAKVTRDEILAKQTTTAGDQTDPLAKSVWGAAVAHVNRRFVH